MTDLHAREQRRSLNVGKALAVRALAALTVLAIIAWAGQYFGHRIPQIEHWIAGLGMWTPVVFLLVLIVSTSLFVPDTLFAMFAGAVFGLVEGSLLMTVGAVATATLNFWTSRRFLRDMVRESLDKHPRLAAIEEAASREGLRLLVLLRLTPIHAVSVSYALGASRVRYGPFLISSFAMLPMLVVEVYFGYLAVHLAKTTGGVHTHSTLHTAVTIIGFVVCAAVMLYITRIAKRALDNMTTSVADDRSE